MSILLSLNVFSPSAAKVKRAQKFILSSVKNIFSFEAFPTFFPLIFKGQNFFDVFKKSIDTKANLTEYKTIFFGPMTIVYKRFGFSRRISLQQTNCVYVNSSMNYTCVKVEIGFSHGHHFGRGDKRRPTDRPMTSKER